MASYIHPILILQLPLFIFPQATSISKNGGWFLKIKIHHKLYTRLLLLHDVPFKVCFLLFQDLETIIS